MMDPNDEFEPGAVHVRDVREIEDDSLILSTRQLASDRVLDGSPRAVVEVA